MAKVDTEIRFEEYPFIVPTKVRMCNKFESLISDLKECGSLRTASLAIKHFNKYMEELMTEINTIEVLYSIDTTSERNKNAIDKINELSPLIQNYSSQFMAILAKSKYRKDLEKEYGKYLLKQYDLALKTFDEKIMNDLYQESVLTSKYDEIMGGAKIEFRGETLNLSQLGKHMQDLDRETRREASLALDNWLKEHDAELGELYDNLVKIRDKIAKTLGYKNFVQLGYDRLGRTDYGPKEVKKYRDAIYEVVTPVVAKLHKDQIKRLGIKNPQFYDYSLMFKDGNPLPNGNPQELVKKATEMYDDMSKETSEFFHRMINLHLVDLEAKPGKAPGGYCTYFPLYKAPFVFSNFNGTKGDVDVLTHEMGHAFQAWMSKDIKVPEYRSPGLETCEIHSMSMEFLAWPYMEKFFGENADKYRYSHLADAIEFLPYGITVDEFQHWVYEHVNATHEERCAKWREIEKRNCPNRVYDEAPTLESGRYWMRQMHIFSSPFYYIDYTLAQVVAFEFLVKSRKNRELTWKKYVKLCKCGGKYPYTETLEVNKLNNPFVDGNLEKSIKPLVKILKEIKID